ncbi:MFS general substrate transporter [Nadsonia fulvescens var. elongata DSM 6958]|uniref:MFS general substrate transporter n=1 Tax=Nadsonia fulvescens var. elongata DSM 6958 TaxID=857566 RepID=A0A1E3PGZ0_9ASCO|nr:MFS general substrate transporter [Nadsonia fulvescens var. elongata DSM 6958]
MSAVEKNNSSDQAALDSQIIDEKTFSPILSTMAVFDEEKAHVDEKNADATLKFMEQYGGQQPLTPEGETKLNRKLRFILLPLILLVNTMLFIDKATLSYASILGIFASTGINSAQFDDLNSIFYAGYTIGQILNLVMQKTKLSKFLTSIVFIWAIVIFCHCGAYNFGGLVVLRFVLGFVESVITPALEITMLQFFTPQERAILQPIFWISCVGISVVTAGFIAYGVLFVNVAIIAPWKVFMIITGGLTLFTSIWCFFHYPSNPAEAKFLTIEERVHLIKRIERESTSSIDQKTIKKYQVIECLKDPVSWLFAAFAFILMISNNLFYQQNLLFVSLGVTNLGSTLVSVAGGGFSTAVMIAGSLFIHFFPNRSAFVILFSCIPAIAGGIAMVTINWENKLALVAMILLAGNTYGLGYIVGLGWSTSSVSGNTKKYVRHIMFMVAYGISNIISPQIWKGNQEPRYYAAWIVQIVVSWVGTPIIAFTIDYILRNRNKERKQYIIEHPDDAYGQIIKKNPKTGEESVENVEIGFLDLTDHENNPGNFAKRVSLKKVSILDVISQKTTKNLTYQLSSGYKIAIIGLGVFLTSKESTKDLVYEALKAGYRHIDSAQIYENEKEVGEGIL